MVWGVIAAVVSAQVVGTIFYSPWILGNVWMKATFPGRSKETIGKEAGPAYAVTLVASAAIALLLNFILVNFFAVKSVVDSIKFAGGLAFLGALVDVPHLAFAQRSLAAFTIDHLFNVCSLVAMAACIFYAK